jgi:peptidyl-prolyl cis-trans isomerase B (cyclophilin B)
VAKRFMFDTARGQFEGELFALDAPGTVANFEKLANSNFYDGTRFHRVIADFVAQGGDPLSKDPGNPRVGTGGPGYHIKCETKGNPNKHQAGSLSMAHAGKDTGGSQFFVAHGALQHLDGVHTVFGRVDGGGMKVVLQIKQGDLINSVRVTDVA